MAMPAVVEESLQEARQLELFVPLEESLRRWVLQFAAVGGAAAEGQGQGQGQGQLVAAPGYPQELESGR